MKDYFDIMLKIPDLLTEKDIEKLKEKYKMLGFEVKETTVGKRLRVFGDVDYSVIEKIEDFLNGE